MEALKCIEYAGRNCYRSEDRITEDSAPRFVRSLIRRGHLSPLEFADMTVELVTSRDVMAEITRHRLASFAIESQRYVNLSGNMAFIRPISYQDGDKATDLWIQHIKQAEETYNMLLDCGMLPEDARKVLPNSTATRIIMKANMREWRHVLSLRTGKGVYPEMRHLMVELL